MVLQSQGQSTLDKTAEGQALDEDEDTSRDGTHIGQKFLDASPGCSLLLPWRRGTLNDSRIVTDCWSEMAGRFKVGNLVTNGDPLECDMLLDDT